MYGVGGEMPVRVRVALTVLGMAGNAADALAPLGEIFSAMKRDKGDAPTATPEPRALTPEEDSVRKAALEVLRLYLTGENDYADETMPEPMVQAMPAPIPIARPGRVPGPCMMIGGQAIPLAMHHAVRIMRELGYVEDSGKETAEAEPAGA